MPPPTVETEGHRLLLELNGLFAQLPDDRRLYDPASEQLILSYRLSDKQKLTSGIIVEPSQDHTRLTWSIHHDGIKTQLAESGDWMKRSPLMQLSAGYFFSLLKGTPAELYFDYGKAEDPLDKKFLVIKPSPDSQQQIRFSVELDTTFHGNVTLEPVGRQIHQLLRINLP